MSGFELDVRLRSTRSVIRGWRGLCSFDGIIAPGGARLFGCELSLKAADRLIEGQEIPASLRFWVPRADATGLATGLKLRLFDGGQQIASGVITEIHET